MRFSGLLSALDGLHVRLKQTEHMYMVLVSIAIGLLGGLGAVGFREFIHLVQDVAWQTTDVSLDYVRSLPWWWTVAAPALGGLIVGGIVSRFAPEAKGHGVPEVMESVALLGGRIRPRVVAAKLVASGVCIGSGGSVGREGPIVQIGSAIGQWLRVGERRLRTLVGCGAAAGIAATFNAPVAGALFAVEIILGDFGVTQFSPIVISSVTATVVSRHFLGDFPAFEVHPYALISAREMLAYAVLGVVAGLAALLFTRVLYAMEDGFDALKVPMPIKAALGGAVVGTIALQFPEVLGVGYEAINGALVGHVAWTVLLLLAVIKIVAVGVTIGSGGSGGVFAPSLFVGAMTGGAVGTFVHRLWPAVTGGPGAYALVGMGAVVAAGTHAPITAIVMIFELTGDYKIILPLMVSCIIATLLATQLQKASIYTLKLLRRGVDVKGGVSVNVLSHIGVGEIMRADVPTVGPEAPLLPVISRFIERPGETVFVVDATRRFMGAITMDEIRPVIADASEVNHLIIAEDMMRVSGFPVFKPDDQLDDVMRRLARYRFQAPVVEDGVLVGGVWPGDVIERYNAEILKRDMAATMAQTVSGSPQAQSLPGVDGMSLAEVAVPEQYFGRTLGSLDIRKRFGVSVVLIKRRGLGVDHIVDKMPDANYTFCEGDVMLVMGSPESIERFERAG